MMLVEQAQDASARRLSVRAMILDRRLPAMLGLGFSSGIPFLLVYATQAAWLSEAKVPLWIISLLSEMTLAYKFKFVWAPFLDRFDPPLLGRLVGRRRAWILVSQLGVAGALAGVAFGDPAHHLFWTVAFSCALGFVGATQDVVIDGWRIAVVPTDRQALMTAWSEVGYRVGNLAAGAGALLLADQVGWHAAYLCMALLMAPGIAAALLAPEPASDLVSSPADPKLSLIETIANPIRELIGRLGRGAIPLLVLVAGFRLPGYVSSAMAIPLFKSLHYSNTDIATVTKLFGFWIALAGTFLASWIITRAGIMTSLLIGTIAGSASHLSLAWLASNAGNEGSEFWLFAITVSIDSFAYAFASIVLITFMSALATDAFAASQFALLTSLCALPGSLLAGLSGLIVEQIGFTAFFIVTSLIGLPVALLCFAVWRRAEWHPVASGSAVAA